MNRSVLQERLRSGRDSNDSTWVNLRYPADWRGALHHRNVSYDAEHKALQLTPVARPQLARDWLALAPVVGPDGTQYKVDPETDQLLRKRACDEDFTPLPGVGGSGFATGRFQTPTSVTLDAKGRLYVADAGNGRVQVIDPDAQAVIALLDEGLVRPMHTAINGTGNIYVADVGTGAIHSFFPDFSAGPILALSSLDPWDETPWPADTAPRPLALTVLPEGTIAVFDPLRPALWHMTCDGIPLRALPWPGDATLPAGWVSLGPRYKAEGEVILGPIDSTQYDMAWHRVLIEADTPPGTKLAVQTFAANEDSAAPNWAPRAPVPMPLADADRSGAEFDRLVQPNADLWPLWRLGRMRRDEPQVHAFEDASGPVAANTMTLPNAVASHIQIGDTIRLETHEGGTEDFQITDASETTMAVAATGIAASFAAPSAIHLIARADGALPFGPVDLGFLTAGTSIGFVGLSRNGLPETASVPHALAAFLQVGDVIALGDPADTTARIEVLEADTPPADVTFTFDRATSGDFSAGTVQLVATAGRLLVQEALPEIDDLAPGNQLTVIDNVHSERHAVAWIDPAKKAIWLGGAFTGNVSATSWRNAEFAAPVATDKGRYLWVRLQIWGAGLPAPDSVGPAVLASATPRVKALRVTGARPRMLDWLPALFSYRDPAVDAPGANFLERFLALFEGQLTRMETAFDSVSRLMNPAATDDNWLSFISAWMDFVFDPSWPVENRRQLVLEGADLHAGAGTPRALVRYLEIYTGHEAVVVEDFRRTPPAPLQLGARGALGIAPLASRSEVNSFAHQFSVQVVLPPDRDRNATISAIHKIVETIKPAHTTYRLDTGEGRSGRIGMDTFIGGIVINSDTISPLCVCDPLAEGGPRPQPGRVDRGFRLGARLGNGPVSEPLLQGGR